MDNKQKTILLCEDNSLLSMVYGFILRISGFTNVTFFDDYPQMQYLFNENAIDIIITGDQVFGMSGTEFVNLFNDSKFRDLPIVMISSRQKEEVLKKISYQNFYYIQRPIDFEKLKAVVSRL